MYFNLSMNGKAANFSGPQMANTQTRFDNNQYTQVYTTPPSIINSRPLSSDRVGNRCLCLARYRTQHQVGRHLFGSIGRSGFYLVLGQSERDTAHRQYGRRSSRSGSAERAAVLLPPASAAAAADPLCTCVLVYAYSVYVYVVWCLEEHPRRRWSMVVYGSIRTGVDDNNRLLIPTCPYIENIAVHVQRW